MNWAHDLQQAWHRHQGKQRAAAAREHERHEAAWALYERCAGRPARLRQNWHAYKHDGVGAAPPPVLGPLLRGQDLAQQCLPALLELLALVRK